MRQIILRPQKSSRAGATWLDVIVFGGLVGVFILGFGVWVMQPNGNHGGSWRRSHCKNNLKQWGLALHNYHDTYQCFPPYAGGTSENGERLSGRAMLLPFLEQDPLWQQIAAAPGQGGDPMKLKLPAPELMEMRMEVFLCPSSAVPVMVDGQAHSSYAFNVGDQLDFGSGVEDFPYQMKTRGPFGWRHCTRVSDMADGTSNIVFMAERDLGNPSNKRDIMGRVAAIVATSPADCLATAADGQYLAKISLLNELMSERWASGHPFYSVFTTAIRPNGPSCAASTPSSGKSVGGWFTASSRHTGGVHVLMGDGTVRFINENISVGDPKATQPQSDGKSSYGIWGAIGTIAGDEVINDF